jgi:hypothetical protein
MRSAPPPPPAHCHDATTQRTRLRGHVVVATYAGSPESFKLTVAHRETTSSITIKSHTRPYSVVHC